MVKAKIGMLSSYPGLGQSDWLWQQTPAAFGEWQQIQLLANEPKPDFLLMYQFDFFKKAYPPKTLVSRFTKSHLKPYIQQVEVESKLRDVPKEKIIYLVREPPLPEVISRLKSNYQVAQDYCSYISGPDEFAPIPEYMPAIWYHNNSFRELDQMEPPAKVKPLSWITSGINRTENHRQRLAFLRLLQESGVSCDFYGRNLPNWVKSGGELNNKWYGMAPYTYNLAIENYADNDLYVSEKLWDSLLAWCLPIYYGGDAADKILPPGSFIRLPSLDEKGINVIKEITATPEAWQKAKDAIAEARQLILHKLNLVNWLSEFVEKHT